MATDPLAEIVTLLRPAARFSKRMEGTGAWRLHGLATGEPFYAALLEGACRVAVDGRPPETLRAGDFILVPALHELVAESVMPPPHGMFLTPHELSPGSFRIGEGNGPADIRMQIGHCSFGSPDASLLVPLLPRVVVARGAPRLVALIQLVGDESRAERPARDLVLQRLLEVLLIEALRSGGDTAVAPGLARGLADERVAAALRALHARPDHPWTVPKLAGEAALSRSAFFARFTRSVGLPPMEYLLVWRMALAKRLLAARELGIDQIARRVGYGSASTFSVAFARHAGLPPARYLRTLPDAAAS